MRQFSLPSPLRVTSFFTIAAMVVFAGVFDILEADVGIASTFLLSAIGIHDFGSSACL